MKSSNLLNTTAFAIISFVLLINCSGKTEHNHDSHEDTTTHASGSTADESPATAPQFSVDATFQQQLGALFNSYVVLKDAFVASDAEKVRSAASSTAQVLAKVDMKLLSGAAHNDWMNYLSGLESSLKEINTGADIQAQRTAFSNLSNTLYKSVKAFGIGGATAYYEYCPMAFDNQGAYWLSDQSQIRNPYFGDEMLTCGVVKETLK